MRGCEVLFDEPQAGMVREMLGCVREAEAAPCRSGLRCPILPKTLGVVSRLSCLRHTMRMDAAS